MDQSLRTVATQLLNVTNPDETPQILDKKVDKSGSGQKTSEKNEASLIKEVNSEISNMESMGIGFGRPINSKFGYFESSHPGQAMALTEEELERELSSTRLITAYKNNPTTTGGISTWILLNPPSTTAKTIENEKKTIEVEIKTNTKSTSQTTEKSMEKVTSAPTITVSMEKTVSSTKRPVVPTTRRTTTTTKMEKTQSSEKMESQATTVAVPRSTTSSLEGKEGVTVSTTTKKTQVVRTTPKPKISVSKTTSSSKTVTSKTSRPNQQTRPKPSTRRTTMRPEIIRAENSTAKIEKVTFRPIQMITTPKTKVESTEKPMFVTKIKASILMDTQKTSTASAPSTSTASLTSVTTTKPILSNADLVEVPVRSKPIGTKVNNVLKVQLKKPLDEATKIEIEPIKVNAPVLKIEKVEKEDTRLEETNDKESVAFDDSTIDVKFDFNPELTKINVESPVEISTSTSTMTTTTQSTSTTKRPRHNSKRKKNKVRRRKPSTSTSTSTTSTTSTSTTPATTIPTFLSSSTVEYDNSTELSIVDVGIQESKIAPETKVSVNSTKTKKKPPQKPISTQIYNFLSREVMPSFGVMSLVGLGLGLASYFLYPFGGTIARRNYEVEPKYKYNLDEYGGNYGQNEEEVLKKVLQGMTTDENKYPGVKDYDNNYYRYQHYDGSYESQTTRKTEQRYPPVSSSPLYRPENTASALKYRNTEYRYPEVQQSTPNYYDRSKHPEFVVGQDVSGTANRQFVVGNVPKEYPPYDEKISTPGKSGNGGYEVTESGQSQFERDIAQNFNFPPNSVNVANYGHQEAQTTRNDDAYEEIEITPTAVAVEHGPRSLKTKRSVDPVESFVNVRSTRIRRSTEEEGSLERSKRDSVIQVIPSKRELEEEEKEENLSNEILDIIDSALPESHVETKKRKEDNEVEDLEAQKRKQYEERKTRLKESTMRTPVYRTTIETVSRTEESTTTSTKEVSSSSMDPSSSSTTDSSKDTTVNGSMDEGTNPPTTDVNTVEWIDLTTKKPEENNFNLFNFVKKVAEIKFRLGLTLLKHASEGFARYLGHVQKRINGEE